MIPETIQKLAKLLSTLPGIGPRQALRLAFYLARLGKQEQKQFQEAVTALSHLKECSECFAISEHSGSLCAICSDAKRSSTLIAIIEKDTDLITLEKSKQFTGRYFILGDLQKAGMLDALHKSRLARLRERVNKNGVLEEIIIALSPTTTGDLNAAMLAKELHGLAKKITRLGRGIPTGGEIEFADEDTLSQALKNRE